MDMVKIVLVGIGGYGASYVKELLSNSEKAEFEITGVVDPNAEKSPYYNDIINSGIKKYFSLTDFYAENSADLAVLSSPIYLHCSQVLTCLQNNSNVLCEKPLAGSLEDGLKMKEAAENSERFVAIGYQWSYLPVIHAIKNDIINGLYGEPLCLKTLVIWPRSESYYKRNGWAGRLKTDAGIMVNDNPANNATAHYLHNMFFVLGDKANTSIYPVEVSAKCYRANNIETYDTIYLRATVAGGGEILFYSTHAAKDGYGPIFEYKFEKGIISMSDNYQITATFNDGSTKEYGQIGNADMMRKLWSCISAVESGEDILCGVDAALPQLICIDKVQKNVEVEGFPQNLIVAESLGENDRQVWVKGLSEKMREYYDNGKFDNIGTF